MTAGGSSIPEVHAVLATLVVAKPGGRFAETGTAYGEGARAIAGSMGEESTFVTVEVDSDRYRRAVEHLAGTRAEVVHGRWEDVLPQRAPFDLLFADGGIREAGGIGVVIPLVASGGFLVDDMSPGRPIEGDEIREVTLRDERLIAVEVIATATSAAIVAVRRSCPPPGYGRVRTRLAELCERADARSGGGDRRVASPARRQSAATARYLATLVAIVHITSAKIPGKNP